MLVEGKQLAEEIIQQLKEEREIIKKKIRLAVVLVGKNSASLSFIKQKQKIARQLNIDFKLYNFSPDLTAKELRKKVSQISRVTYNRGIVVQLPLPPHINPQVVLNGVLPEKDPDVLTERNLGKFYTGRLSILPPVVSAIKYILEKYQIPITGKKVLVIGRGRLVGKPVSLWFLQQGATLIVANSQTKDLSNFTKLADIIVSGAGKPHLITNSMIKKGVVIFDCGIVTVEGRLTGDCDTHSMRNVASLITPVPGGIGPLTVAFLFKNLLELTKKQKR